MSEERVVGMDHYPTMLATAGVPQRPEQHIERMNLMPILTAESELDDRPIIFHFPHYTHATRAFSSIILNHWKLIQFYNNKKGDYLLYNLKHDPNEQEDLASNKADVVERLKDQLDKSFLSMNAEMPAKNPNFETNQTNKRMNLSFTKGLAERKRVRFETRVNEKDL